ncbi:MAG TPA: DUF2867 domain-containing protein [Solirubrobacterales bacterium]|nr:DUF2867 domain-containing protein [Solirubrobacterales bacterium]
MRLPDSAHTSRPWRIHEIAPDFELEDVWALPTPGGPDDFPELVELARSLDPGSGSSPIVRLLFAVRWKLGSLFGWDDESAGLGARVPTVRDRLPDDLRESGAALPAPELPFSPLYLTENEMAAEVANRTMHGILHLGWVEDGASGYRGQMAILVKRNGRLGALYMAAIAPFRYLVVYPLMMREFGALWRERTRGRGAAVS